MKLGGGIAGLKRAGRPAGREFVRITRPLLPAAGRGNGKPRVIGERALHLGRVGRRRRSIGTPRRCRIIAERKAGGASRRGCQGDDEDGERTLIHARNAVALWRPFGAYLVSKVYPGLHPGLLHRRPSDLGWPITSRAFGPRLQFNLKGFQEKKASAGMEPALAVWLGPWHGRDRAEGA